MTDRATGPRELWILRHFHAEAATEPDGDALRPLSRKGREDGEDMGRRLAEAGVRPARVVSSPLLRALESAALAAAPFEGLRVEEDGRLAPGGDGEGLVDELLDAGRFPCLLVGHNPDLELLAFGLTGRGVHFRKGTLVRLAPGEGERTLLEVMEPRRERHA